jgi:hypothetical protein
MQLVAVVLAQQKLNYHLQSVLHIQLQLVLVVMEQMYHQQLEQVVLILCFQQLLLWVVEEEVVLEGQVHLVLLVVLVVEQIHTLVQQGLEIPIKVLLDLKHQQLLFLGVVAVVALQVLVAILVEVQVLLQVAQVVVD